MAAPPLTAWEAMTGTQPFSEAAFVQLSAQGAVDAQPAVVVETLFGTWRNLSSFPYVSITGPRRGLSLIPRSKRGNDIGGALAEQEPSQIDAMAGDVIPPIP